MLGYSIGNAIKTTPQIIKLTGVLYLDDNIILTYGVF